VVSHSCQIVRRDLTSSVVAYHAGNSYTGQLIEEDEYAARKRTADDEATW